MRVLVCGCRDWKAVEPIQEALFGISQSTDETCVLIHGDAKGADRIAAGLGYRIGWAVAAYPADWDQHSKAAGVIRNRKMLDEGKPDLVLAFWDGKSRGTMDMISRAVRAGVLVKVFPKEMRG